MLPVPWAAQGGSQRATPSCWGRCWEDKPLRSPASPSQLVVIPRFFFACSDPLPTPGCSEVCSTLPSSSSHLHVLPGAPGEPRDPLQLPCPRSTAWTLQTFSCSQHRELVLLCKPPSSTQASELTSHHSPTRVATPSVYTQDKWTEWLLSLNLKKEKLGN